MSCLEFIEVKERLVLDENSILRVKGPLLSLGLYE
jgi:hypothetical protein